MKSEIMIQDFGGVHNGNLKQSRARIIKGGSWKKQRIIVILPASDTMSTKVALSHWNLAFPPNQPVMRILALGDEVGVAYSQAIQGILDHPELSKWEYILTIEHDNMPPPDGVLRLLERMEQHPEFDCIGGLYWTKGEGGCPQIWGDVKDSVVNFRPQPPDPNGGLVECCGTGMGFNLFRLKLFKNPNLRKPWFVTQNGAGGCSTQDLYFASDARKFGYRCACDCGIRVGHYDVEADIVW